ncbi:MAG: hypothetical protein ACLUVG_13190 [Phocaeicola vulgatus]
MGVSCFHFLMSIKAAILISKQMIFCEKYLVMFHATSKEYTSFTKSGISFENIIYIGKAGTISQLGIYGKQALYGRINNQQDDAKRQTFFSDSMKANGIHQIIIQWFVTVDDKHSDIPHCIEARLIQKYYKKTKELPLWNRNY